jgi:hypothetical protein
VTTLLCEKEKKHPNYATEIYEKLSTEKASKVKSFAKDWVKKLIDHSRKSSSHPSSSSKSSSHRPSSSASSRQGHKSSSTSTPTQLRASDSMTIGSSSGLATPLSASDSIEERELVASMLADVDDGEEDMEEGSEIGDETIVVAVAVVTVGDEVVMDQS